MSLQRKVGDLFVLQRDAKECQPEPETEQREHQPAALEAIEIVATSAALDEVPHVARYSSQSVWSTSPCPCPCNAQFVQLMSSGPDWTAATRVAQRQRHRHSGHPTRSNRSRILLHRGKSNRPRICILFYNFSKSKYLKCTFLVTEYLKLFLESKC